MRSYILVKKLSAVGKRTGSSDIPDSGYRLYFVFKEDTSTITDHPEKYEIIEFFKNYKPAVDMLHGLVGEHEKRFI